MALQAGLSIWALFYSAVLILLSLNTAKCTAVPLILFDSVSVNFAATFVGLLAFSGCCCCPSSPGTPEEASDPSAQDKEDTMGICRVDNAPAGVLGGCRIKKVVLIVG